MKICFSALAFLGLALIGISVNLAGAGVITEGFENTPGSYNLATAGGGTASIVTSPVHSGSQALNLSLTTSSDYARVKLDVTSDALTLGQITGADYWVDRTAGAASSQLPYILFSINTPGSGGDSTLAVMYNNPAAFGATYTDLTVGPSTLFHVEGDTSGLTDPSSITLADLESSTYSPGVSWGSFGVDFVRIGYGQAGDDSIASSSNVDDLSIDYSAVPEPAALSLIGVAGLALLRRGRTRSSF